MSPLLWDPCGSELSTKCQFVENRHLQTPRPGLDDGEPLQLAASRDWGSLCAAHKSGCMSVSSGRPAASARARQSHLNVLTTLKE